MSYRYEGLWLPAVCAVCPSQDTANDGTATLRDFCGVSNMTLTNMATVANNWVTSDSKRAIELDGTNDHAINSYCPVSISSIVTMSAWIKKASSSYGPHITLAPTIANAVANQFTMQPWNDGVLYLSIGSAYGSFALNDTNWHHILAVFDGTQTGNANRLQMWCDGVSKTLTFSGTIPAALTSSGHRLFVGATPTVATTYGAGCFDDVRVTLQVPTSDERTVLSSGRGAAFARSQSVSSPFSQQVIA